MKLKKLLAMMTAVAMIFALAIIPASAEATTIVAPQDNTVAPGADVTVTVNITHTGHGLAFELSYDTADLTYVADSFAVLGGVIGDSDLSVTAEDGKIIVVALKDGMAFDDTAVFTADFTAKAEIEGASEETTITTAANINGFLDSEYLPVDEAAIEYGSATITISLLPTAPVAENVVILKDEAALEEAPMVGETLAVDYDYSDVNGDDEDGTAIQWYADDEAIEGATDAEYTLTAAELGKEITVGVTPANAAEKGDEAVEAVSETATEPVAVNPELKATVVEGSLAIDPADKIKVGKAVVVSYEIDSPNGGEDESIIAWTDDAGNELAGEVSEDGKTFTPSKDDKDKIIKVTVTPKDSLTDANEEAVVELVAEVPVTKTTNNISAFVPNSGGSLVPKTEEPEKTEEPTETPDVAGIEKFTDVPADTYAWAVEGIDALVKAGIIVGVTDTTFEPETKTTRAHFVAMVMRAVDAIDEEAKASYADVAADYWGYKEIASAEALGALEIFGENFEPEKVITREEMAYVLHEVATALEIALPDTEAAEEFSDAASIAEAAADCVTALQKAGILHGMGDGTFMPKGETTRAQAAKVVHILWTLAK